MRNVCGFFLQKKMTATKGFRHTPIWAGPIWARAHKGSGYEGPRGPDTRDKFPDTRDELPDTIHPPRGG